MKKSLFSMLLFLSILSKTLFAQELAIYNINLLEDYNGQNRAFSSFSDSYLGSEGSDTLMIPDYLNLGPEKARYIPLEGKYRQRFLKATTISESDYIYCYDYAKDLLVSFPVKSLKVVAFLSLYQGEDDWPYRASDYQIGFEINPESLKEFGAYYIHALLAVGKENPFVRGGMKPMVWTETDSLEFPNLELNERYIPYLKRCSKGKVYKFEWGGYRYLTQDLNFQNRLLARHLIVLDLTKNNTKPVCDKIYLDSEGTSPAPLNYYHSKEDYLVAQFTGKLFKNKPPVVLGFLYVSFGCPAIAFLDPSEQDLFIRCDNRH
jgi:hypothetical protein